LKEIISRQQTTGSATSARLEACEGEKRVLEEELRSWKDWMSSISTVDPKALSQLQGELAKLRGEHLTQKEETERLIALTETQTAEISASELRETEARSLIASLEESLSASEATGASASIAADELQRRLEKTEADLSLIGSNALTLTLTLTLIGGRSISG